MSDMEVVAEHVGQLLDLYASNPSYNCRAAFLLADDVAELMLKAYIKAWRHKNPGVLPEPDNFPQTALFTILSWSPKAGLAPAAVRHAWEALEPIPNRRWRGQHINNIADSA